MKNFRLLLALIAFTAFMGCKKDTDVNISTFKLIKEKIVTETLLVRMEGTFEYAGKINSIEMKIGQNADLSDAQNHRAIVNGTEFNITVTGLLPMVDYYYCYEIDYGASST